MSGEQELRPVDRATKELMEKSVVAASEAAALLYRVDLENWSHSLAGVQERIRQWGAPIFTESTVLSTAKHLAVETVEVLECAETLMGMPDSTVARSEAMEHLAEELADVIHLVMHCANTVGINVEAAFDAKFAKNQRRTWKPPNEEGIVLHEKEG